MAKHRHFRGIRGISTAAGATLCLVLICRLAYSQAPIEPVGLTPFLRLNIPAHTATINNLAFSPDSQRLYTAGSDKIVRVWKNDAGWAASGVLRWEVGPGFHGDIYGLAVAPRADIVAVAGYGSRGGVGEIVWLNANEGDYSASFFPQRESNTPQHLETISSLAFSPDGRWFASSDLKGRVLLWNGQGGGPVAVQNQPRALRPALRELNPPRAEQNVGRYPIAFVGSDWLVYPTLTPNTNPKIWTLKAEPLNAAGQNQPSKPQTLDGRFLHQVSALAGSSNGRYLAATMYSAREPHKLVLYELQQGTSAKPITLENFKKDAAIYSLSFSGDGRFLAVGRQKAGGGAVELWDIRRRAKVWESPPTLLNVVLCSLSPDGEWLAFASGTGNDVSIGRIDQATGQVANLQCMPGGNRIDAVGFVAGNVGPNTGGNRIFFRNNAKERWLFDPSKNGADRCRQLDDREKPVVFRNDVRNWAVQTVLKEAPPNSLAGALIVTAGNREAGRIVFNPDLDRPAATCWICDQRGAPIELAVAMSPSNLIHIYQVPRQPGQLRLLRTFIGHQAMITSLEISPDQKYLVSGASDGAVAVWPLGSYRSGEMLTRRWGAQLKSAPGGQLQVAALDAQGPLYNRGIRQGDLITQIEWPDAQNPERVVHRSNRPEDIIKKLAPSLPATHLDTISFHTTRNGVAQPLAQTPPYWHPLLMLYTHDQEWIAWTPTGYFDSSAGGERLIGWQFSQKLGESPFFATAQQYYPQFHRPDLIKQLLLSAAVPASAEPIARNKIPVIRLLKPAPGDTNQKVVRIEAEITPPFESGTLTVAPMLNGMAFDPEPLTISSGSPVVWRGDVTLENHVPHEIGVRVDATNSSSALIRWIPHDHERPRERKPILHLLAVGISDYSAAYSAAGKRYTNLEDAPSDAQSITNVFVAQKAGYYAAVKSRVLINEDSETIVAELSKLMKPRSEDGPSGIDTVAFYFAGHGDVDSDGSFCLVTKEGKSAELTSRKLLRRFCTTGRFRKLLILDACNSGAAWDDISNDWQQLKRRGLRGGWPANFFAACQKDQPAIDPKGGIFTFCIVRGLVGEAWTSKRPLPHVDVRHLEDFLPSRVETEIGNLSLPAKEKLAKRDLIGDGGTIQQPVIWTDQPTNSVDRRNWESLQLTTPSEEYTRGVLRGPASR